MDSTTWRIMTMILVVMSGSYIGSYVLTVFHIVPGTFASILIFWGCVIGISALEFFVILLVLFIIKSRKDKNEQQRRSR